ncbi:MAG: helix-turn-helix domain-containing protein [Clostridia bacterium]|nr:helix-turn-helix domain-containing protein [Clostridia bacterium]
MDFGKKIADARTKANITQQELADKLFVSRELISKWENGTRRPNYGTFTKIAEALSVPVDSLIRREDCVFEELEACIPQGREIPRERLSHLIGRFTEGLPQPDSGMFIRRYYLLISNAEIASEYGISENKVRSRLSRTIGKLKKYLKEECKNG